MSRSSDSIVSLFVEHASKHPEKRCLTIGDDQVSYGELRQRVSQLKGFFEKCGVGCGDNVLMTLLPSIDFYASTLAIFAIGAVVVVLDTSMGLKRANHCIRLAKPVAWIHERGKFWYFRV
jgi:acyl-CoA synthetase (AMP-forming)/AMP-acid ligase II